jgi:hypothetical protein
MIIQLGNAPFIAVCFTLWYKNGAYRVWHVCVAFVVLAFDRGDAVAGGA